MKTRLAPVLAALGLLLAARSSDAALKSRAAAGTPSITPAAPAAAAAGSAGAAPGAPAPFPARALALGGLPLSFAENVGQWQPATRFSGSVPGATLLFGADAVTCVLTRGSGPHDDAAPAARPGAPRESLALRATFPGATATTPAGEALAAHYSHYYYGNDPAAWRTDVRNFNAVRYAGLYPGVDLVYHGRDGQLEYDFELRPGADWRRIRVRYDGVEGLAVTPGGHLALQTRFGRITEQAPKAWQTIDGARRPVRVRYRLLADNTFGFHVLDRLDPAAPLVIDPILHYSTYLGGSSYDEPHGIDYNAAGEAFVVGGTLSPNFPATGSPVPATNYSVFVTRLAANGQSLVWSVFLGGSADQIGYGIDVDPFGNSYISGTTGSNNFPTTPGCYDPTFNGANSGVLDMFVARLAPNGGLTYGSYLGGTDSDTNAGIKLSLLGQVYIYGDGGSNYPTTPGCYDATQNGASDVVLSIMNFNGAGAADLVYSTYLGGNDYDEAHGLGIDMAGNAYVGGATRSSNFPAGGGPPFNGSFDAFLAEINPGAAGPADLLYCQKWGGVGQDYGGAVDITLSGGVAFDGITASPNFPTTAGCYQPTYGGGPYDGFVMVVFPSANFVSFSTFLGGPNTDRPGPIHEDVAGNVTVVGATDSPTFPVTAGAFDPGYNGLMDIFISKIDLTGATLLYSTFLGGSIDDIPYDYKVDSLGRQYLTGTTMSADFPTTTNAFDTSYSGGAIDAVVVKFQAPLPESCAVCVSPADTCCERAPHFQGIEAPTLSPHVLVTTREPSNSWPYAVTIFDLGSPTPTEDVNWATVLKFHGPFNNWCADSLGSVFGLTLDEYGNIFVTHTSCYDQDLLGQVPGGGPGAVYRIDAVNGSISTFCRLPNYPDPNVPAGYNLPGLGNISYDCRHKQFFVTDLEDGRIYRIKPNGVNALTGTIQQVFDPFVADTGPTNYLTPLNNVPSPGWAPKGERLWGVQWHMDRVFYSVWAEDGDNMSPTISNEIRSVALDNAGAFVSGSDQHELFMPPMPGFDFSMPVADISFDASGKMLLGERGISNTTSTSPHMARNLEYGCEAGCWLPANAYQIGACCGGTNAGGGVDYDRFAFTGGPVGRVWGSGDALHLGFPYVDEVYGYQGTRPTGGSNVNAILIDDDGNTQDQDKTFLGDIEAPGCVNNDVGQICGQKFRDLNHDGIRQNGEPTLPGWTITLNGPGGPYTVVTDEQGHYCFDNLAPGFYTLAEVGQAGWVQTAPPGGVYAVSVTGGQLLTGKDFGNYLCPATPPCVMPPPGMSAWYTFDEAGGATTAADNAHLGPAKNTLQLFGGAGFTSAGEVGNALHLGGAADYARLPNIMQAGLDFGSGSFAFDAWVNVAAGTAGPRVIAEKRELVSTSPYRTRGWALYLDGQQCKLEIGTSEMTETFAGPILPADTWTHLAVSVERGGALPPLGTWYVDGVPNSALSFSPPAGTVFNNADLYVGRRNPVFGTGVPFDGYLDELEFFHSPLAAQSAAAIPNVGHAGKCREYCRLPLVTSICKDKTTVTVCINIVNNTNTPQSYHWSMAGLPAGAGCTVNGPISFSPAAGSVTVPAGSTSPNICVTMPRPAGLTAQNATACFAFTYVNDQTGACHSCTGTIRADNSCWCVTPVQTGVVGVGQRFAGIIGVPIDIGIRHPCDPIGIMAYQVSAVYEPGDHPDPHAVSLNGLPPGEPVFGTLIPGPGGPGGGGDEPPVSVLVTFPAGYDPAGLYQIVMDADTDGDGLMERVSCTPIASTYEADPVAGVPIEPITPQALRLLAMPNPFRTGSTTVAFTLPVASTVDLAVYDISGRLVRALQSGPLAAGTQNILWDGRDDNGRDVAGGIYFVRLRADKALVQTKVVKVR